MRCIGVALAVAQQLHLQPMARAPGKAQEAAESEGHRPHRLVARQQHHAGHEEAQLHQHPAAQAQPGAQAVGQRSAQHGEGQHDGSEFEHGLMAAVDHQEVADKTGKGADGAL
jgi:hypothetical protein